MELEARGLGATEPEVEIFGRRDAQPIMLESIRITLKSVLHWLVPAGLVVLSALAGYVLFTRLGGISSDNAVGWSMLWPILFSPWVLTTFLRTVLARKRGEPLTCRQAMGFGLSAWPGLLWTGFVLALGMLLLEIVLLLLVTALTYASPWGYLVAVPLAIAVVCVVTYCVFHCQLVVPVCVFERRGPLASLRRSIELSKGRAWAITVTSMGAGMMAALFFYGFGLVLLMGGGLLAVACGAPSFSPSSWAEQLALAGCGIFFLVAYGIILLTPLAAQLLCYERILDQSPADLPAG